ncbi:hypothetical protein G3580_13385 [Nitrogeniibacter mangrovi]|uniref:Uncharacterized protein n=1 Tax=Nitrogeniibacter mangrovi TaxID=2016596 RepID=A0A6C1B6U5_9RHOO|nr:hypothetical protein [Nitrogeniibacter mangrovi]QID18535.1 hypothetical protein G3580_13385 [Nitrogeniibacter mangrovi]
MGKRHDNSLYSQEEIGVSSACVELKLAEFWKFYISGRREGGYANFGNELKSLGEIAALFNGEEFCRLALGYFIDKFDFKNTNLDLPGYFKDVYEREFSRMKKNMNPGSGFSFSLGNDRFVKDLAIAGGRLIPIGPGLVEVGGFPRRLLWSGGIRQFFKFAKFYFLRARRNFPYLEIHTHLENVQEFNELGWKDAYYKVADILSMNSFLRGVFRGSWFVDPVISKICPHLSYIRDFPVSWGAESFYYSTEGGSSDAISSSKTRRRLFEENKYEPKVYVLIWPRLSILRFAKKPRGVCFSSPDSYGFRNDI